MALDNPDLALPKGSLILVTGATGFIASNIVREALDLGYRVRGTARSQEKADRTKQLFNSEDYEVIVVPEMEHDGAYDQAVNNVDAIIHTASPVIMDPDPNKVVVPAIKGTISIMNSAVDEHSVKRFVFTSSSAAAVDPRPGEKFKIDRNSWNHELEQYADYPPPYDNSKGVGVYKASKLKAEQALWDFVKHKKPHFVVNSVVPDFNMGRLLDSPSTTGKLITMAYEGIVLWHMPPQHMIDVVDDARIHVAAAIDKSVANERIFAFNKPFTWNDVLDIFRMLRPGKTFPENRELQQDLSEVDNQLGADLLKKWWAQNDYTGLEESVRQNIEHLD